MTCLSDLLKLHNCLDEMFFEHQRDLLHFEFEKAFQALLKYETALLIHMRDEEEIVLPVYAKYDDIPRVGDAKLFFDEHEKMRAYVGMFLEATEKLSASPAHEAELLMLLDREAFYKRLTGHHDKREHDFLYPILDERTTSAEKSQLLGRVRWKIENISAA